MDSNSHNSTVSDNINTDAPPAGVPFQPYSGVSLVMAVVDGLQDLLDERETLQDTLDELKCCIFQASTVLQRLEPAAVKPTEPTRDQSDVGASDQLF